MTVLGKSNDFELLVRVTFLDEVVLGVRGGAKGIFRAEVRNFGRACPSVELVDAGRGEMVVVEAEWRRV